MQRLDELDEFEPTVPEQAIERSSALGEVLAFGLWSTATIIAVLLNGSNAVAPTDSILGDLAQRLFKC